MTDIYIDCEWNEFGGDLISMALVADDGREFYEVLGCESPGPWVAEHVMPILGKAAISQEEFTIRLQAFLAQFSYISILADWPEDIERFCKALITGPGARIGPDYLTFTFNSGLEAESSLPHNALEDARAIFQLRHNNADLRRKM